MTDADRGHTTFTAHGQKSDRSYIPSFGFEGPLLTPRHGAVHEQVEDVDGWLQPEDSLKLYELGYLARGPFLEIGTYRGKSTSVLATALRDADRRVEFYSLDIARDDLERARTTLSARGLGRFVTLVQGSVIALLRSLPTFQPRFVFVDGDHSAAGLGRDLASLETRVPEGGLLLFHDFTDVRNDDPTNRDYGVTEAIRRSWVARDCEFAGAFGCGGLYRRLRGMEGGVADDDAPRLIDLTQLDRLSTRFLVKVARPVKRRARSSLRRLPGSPRPD